VDFKIKTGRLTKRIFWVWWDKKGGLGQPAEVLSLLISNNQRTIIQNCHFVKGFASFSKKYSCPLKPLAVSWA
jgi:hypothetical protein